MSNKQPDSGRATPVSPELHQKYWQQSEEEKQRLLHDHYAQRDALDPYATSRDYNQRELEIFALKKALESESPGKLIDFGCGNGYTLLSIAKSLTGWHFEGVDFSETLIRGALTLRSEAHPDVKSNVTFHCGDAISHIASVTDGSLDAVVTERFLLNLPSKDAQRSFIKGVHRTLRKGGQFLMCEGSMEGFRGLNTIRASVGLQQIAETSEDNLSAIRFEDREIEEFVASVGFNIVRKEGFSYFFAMSRALHPALVLPEQPRFNSKINDLARQMQMNLPLTPGIGSNVLWVLQKD